LHKEIIIVNNQEKIVNKTIYKPFEIMEMVMYGHGKYRSKHIKYRTSKNVMQSHHYYANNEETWHEDSVFLKSFS
jgi:hypothetical protein